MIRMLCVSFTRSMVCVKQGESSEVNALAKAEECKRNNNNNNHRCRNQRGNVGVSVVCDCGFFLFFTSIT